MLHHLILGSVVSATALLVNVAASDSLPHALAHAKRPLTVVDGNNYAKRPLVTVADGNNYAKRPLVTVADGNNYAKRPLIVA